MLLFDIFTPSFILWPSIFSYNFFLIHNIQVKTKDGQKMDEGLKVSKSNIWPT